MAYFGITATDGGLRAAARGDESPPGCGAGWPAAADRARRSSCWSTATSSIPTGPTPTRTARSSRCSPRRRLADPQLAGGARLRRRCRRERPLRRLRLAGERAAPREPRSPPGATASPGSTTAPAPTASRLAELVALLQRLAPGRPVDVLAHSLGARVALAALPHLDASAGPDDPARRRRVRRGGTGVPRSRARRAPDASLQRHLAGERSLRPDARDASRRAATAATGRSAQAWARRSPPGSTCSSTAPRSPPGSTPRASR